MSTKKNEINVLFRVSCGFCCLFIFFLLVYCFVAKRWDPQLTRAAAEVLLNKKRQLKRLKQEY